MRADLHELVDGGKSPDDHPLADLDMPAQGGAVGEDGLVADDAVVGDMCVRHQQDVIAQPRDALIVGRAAVDGTALAEDVAVADLQPRRLAGVLLVLRRAADGGERGDLIVRAHAWYGRR